MTESSACSRSWRRIFSWRSWKDASRRALLWSGSFTNRSRWPGRISGLNWDFEVSLFIAAVRLTIRRRRRKPRAIWPRDFRLRSLLNSLLPGKLLRKRDSGDWAPNSPPKSRESAPEMARAGGFDGNCQGSSGARRRRNRTEPPSRGPWRCCQSNGNLSPVLRPGTNRTGVYPVTARPRAPAGSLW